MAEEEVVAMDTDKVVGGSNRRKRRRSDTPVMEEKEDSPEEDMQDPPAFEVVAALNSAAVRRAEMRSWARALPEVPPQREEFESPTALIQGTRCSLIELEDLIFELNPNMPSLHLRSARNEGDYILKGVVPSVWPSLKTLPEVLEPLDVNRPVLVRAPLSFITNEDLAVMVRVPYGMDHRSFAQQLELRSDQRKPTAISSVMKDGKRLNLMKVYCASKSHKKRLLKQNIRWNGRKLKVEKPKRTSRKTQRAERDQN